MSTEVRTVIVSSRSSLKTGPNWGRRAVIGAGVATALTALAGLTIGEDKKEPDSVFSEGINLAPLLAATLALYEGQLAATSWQAIAEELFRAVDPRAIEKLVALDSVLSKHTAQHPIRGALDLPIAVSELFPKREAVRRGLSARLMVFRAGRAMPPHAHDHLAGLTYVVRGRFRVRHYGRIHDEDKGLLLKPTVDRILGPSDATSFSETKDNVHWHEAQTDGILLAVFCKDLDGYPSKQVMVDPLSAERVSGGLMLAPRMPSIGEALERYG